MRLAGEEPQTALFLQIVPARSNSIGKRSREDHIEFELIMLMSSRQQIDMIGSIEQTTSVLGELDSVWCHNTK